MGNRESKNKGNTGGSKVFQEMDFNGERVSCNWLECFFFIIKTIKFITKWNKLFAFKILITFISEINGFNYVKL